MAELPQSTEVPDGRLVVGVSNGAAYSDDGGVTWTISTLWQQFRWWVYNLAVVKDPANPYGGTVLAGLGDYQRGVSGVWASEDGGQTWEERIVWSGLGSPDRTTLEVGADGSVYAATNDIGPDPNMGKVYRSRDAGLTWEDISGPETGWGRFGTFTLEIGRDGRLYAATDGGVWRTSEPLPVAGAEGPEVASVLSLRIDPNPSSGSARVRLTLAVPESEVRVAVFDIKGREVAVLANGARAAGEHAFVVDTHDWSPGVYVARVEAGGAAASARFTVVQ